MVMADEIQNSFVRNMLKSASEKKEVKAQTRTEGVDRDAIEKMAEALIKKRGQSPK